MSNNFETFEPGTIFNPFMSLPQGFISFPLLDNVTINYPSRINAMAIDPSKIAGENNSKLYSAGEIVFSIKNYISIKVSISKSGKSEYRGKRKILIEHAALMMKKILNYNEGLQIEVINNDEQKHVGLGSSSRLICGVMTAINEIYGNPISPRDLVKIASQNHGEESNNANLLQHVQSIGGSAASGLFPGGLQIIAGNGEIIFNNIIPQNYKIVMGIPLDHTPKSAEDLMNAENSVMPNFIECGKNIDL